MDPALANMRGYQRRCPRQQSCAWEESVCLAHAERLDRICDQSHFENAQPSELSSAVWTRPMQARRAPQLRSRIATSIHNKAWVRGEGRPTHELFARQRRQVLDPKDAGSFTVDPAGHAECRKGPSAFLDFVTREKGTGSTAQLTLVFDPLVINSIVWRWRGGAAACIRS